MARSGAVGAREGVGLEPETTEQAPGPGTNGATILAVVVSLGIHAAVLGLAWQPTTERDGPCIESCFPGNPYVEMMLRGPAGVRSAPQAAANREWEGAAAESPETKPEDPLRWITELRRVPQMHLGAPYWPCTDVAGFGPFDARDRLSGTAGDPSAGRPESGVILPPVGARSCSLGESSGRWSTDSPPWWEYPHSCRSGGDRGREVRPRRGVGRGAAGAAPTATSEGGCASASVVDAGPSVRFEEPRASGPIDATFVRRIVQQHRGRLRHCVEAAERSGIDAGDRATIVLRIESDGRVEWASAAFEHAALSVELCLEDVLRRVSFPPDESPTYATFTLRFERAVDPCRSGE